MRLLNFVQGFLASIQRHPRKPRAVRARQNTAATKLFRRLTLESLEDRRVLANISVTSVQLADGSLIPITQAVVGEEIFVRVDYTTDALNANTSYRIAYTVDGVTLSHVNITSGAGLASGSWNWSRAGWFAESTGTHNAAVTVDADNTITETSEFDNSASFSFTVVTATPPVQFSWPVPGVPFIDVGFWNYLDLDPTSGLRDWAGGQATYDGHFGLDLGSFSNEGMDVGMPILAAAPGTVVEVEDGNYDRSYGTINNVTPGGLPNYVIINHGNGWRTRYYHLRRDSIRVQVGDVVKRGDHIAFEGSSGNSTGSHLHLDVEHNLQPVETFLDPTVYWQTPPPYVGTTLYLNETGITNYNPATPNDHFRERPSDVEVFSQASGQTVYAWGVYTGLRSNDLMQAIFKRPDGSTFATNTYTIQSDWSTSHWYFIRPLPSVPDVGTWTVEYLVNGVELGSDTFLVTATGAPEARLEETNGEIVLDGRYTPYDSGNVNVGAAGPNQAFRMVSRSFSKVS